MPAFLAGAAVTVIPSARETFGNLALESLSAGTPVVAYATGNLPALLDGTGAGVLVPAAAGPGAAAVSSYARAEAGPLPQAGEFRALPGLGASGVVDGVEVIAGAQGWEPKPGSSASSGT